MLLFFQQSDKISGPLPVSAGEGRVDIIEDLQVLLDMIGPQLMYFGDSDSNAAAIRYLQAQGV